jgi:hypothetical protein
MMPAQCPSCGTYYTGNEAVCTRCGAPRAANAYQQNPYGQPGQQNPYGQPGPYGQPYQQQPQTFGQRLQNYYTPRRIITRMIIWRLIGLGIGLLIVGGCAVFILLSALASSAANH